MSSPAHSLHIAVATPATMPLVREHLRRDAHQMASSVSCCVTCIVPITTSRGRGKDSWATGFTFLCSPTSAAAFHLETTTERSTGRRGTCLLAFPHQLGRGIARGYSIGFALAEDLVEEAPNFPSPVFSETPTYMPQSPATVSAVEGGTPWSTNHLQSNTKALSMMFSDAYFRTLETSVLVWTEGL